MATQKGKFFSVLIGNYILYELNGVQCVRSKPARKTMKQTRPTKAAAKQFGRASSMSARLRSGLSLLLQDINQGDVMYRFNHVMQQWLQNGSPGTGTATGGFSFIDRFQFNSKTSLAEKLVVPLSVDWDQPKKIVISIPKLVPTRDIGAPAYTETVQWMFAMASCTVQQHSSLVWQNQNTIEMKYTEKAIAADKIELQTRLKPGELSVVALSLRYIITAKGKTVVQGDEQWMPAGIIGSYYAEK